MLLVISPDRILMAVAWPYIKLFNLPLCLSTTFCDVVRFIFVGLKSPLMQAQFTYCRCMEINIYSSWLYQCCPNLCKYIEFFSIYFVPKQTEKQTNTDKNIAFLGYIQLLIHWFTEMGGGVGVLGPVKTTIARATFCSQSQPWQVCIRYLALMLKYSVK